MSFNPYRDNPLIPAAAETGVKWEWLYLESLEILPEQLGVNFRHVADTLYRLIGPDPARVPGALRLQELVERTLQNDGEVSFDYPITGRYQVHIGVRDEPASGATLDEAVEAALKELSDD